MNFAHLIKRSLAYWVDCLIAFGISMLLIQWLVLSQIRGIIGIDDEWFHSSWNMELYVLLTISIPVWFYFAILDSSSKRGTFGKQLFKLVVTQEAKEEKIGFGKSFIRTLLKLLPWEIAHIGIIFPVPMNYVENPEVRVLSIVGLVLFIVYFVSIAIDQHSQSLYDRLLKVEVKVKAKTKIEKTDSER